MAQHAAPEPPRHAPAHELIDDRRPVLLPLDDQTADLAECIEAAICEIVGDSPLIRSVSVHASRAVQLWIDYQLQRGTLRSTITTMVDTPTGEIPGVRWRAEEGAQA